jgi:hypothetical protein
MIMYACTLKSCRSHASPSAARKALAAPVVSKMSLRKLPRLMTWYNAPSYWTRSRRAMPFISMTPAAGGHSLEYPKHGMARPWRGPDPEKISVLRPDPTRVSRERRDEISSAHKAKRARFRASDGRSCFRADSAWPTSRRKPRHPGDQRSGILPLCRICIEKKPCTRRLHAPFPSTV